MRTHCTTSLMAFALTLAASLLAPAARASTAPAPTPAPVDFSCSGPVHDQAIRLWQAVRPHIVEHVQENLLKQGDVYTLYNTQVELQSFVEMTRRCKDHQQITELVDALSPAFGSLRPLPDAPGVYGWVCTGGSTCTPSNKLLGKEVQLCSAQFLGLIGALATDIVETIPANQRTEAEKAFVSNAATAMATQVDHWLSPAYFQSVSARMQMTPADATDGKSTYFFEDRDLWFMTSLADLAELHHAGISLDRTGVQAFKSLQAKHVQIAHMFDLFLARTTMTSTPSGQRAEIDRGYWRSYGDSKFAAYSAATSPVLCQKNALGVMTKHLRVESKASYIDPNLGWDISHARRLVPALDTFVRNKSNLAAVFGYRNAAFDPAKLQRAFANQIVDIVWNRDRQYPLFSNFWDGSNGWYRAGYDNGTGSCRPGEAPYSLAWSYPTGSYPQWGRFNSTLQTLSRQLYTLFNSTDPKAAAFIGKNYAMLKAPSASVGAAANSYNIWSLVFLSSMVGT